MGTVSFLGVKLPGLGDDHPPHLAPRLKKELSYTSTPPLGLHGLLYGDLYLYFTFPRLNNTKAGRAPIFLLVSEVRHIQSLSLPGVSLVPEYFTVHYVDLFLSPKSEINFITPNYYRSVAASSK